MIIQEIVAFFKRIFNKKEKQKMLIAPKIQEEQIEKVNFIKSIKIESINKKKRTVETPICLGDGLGIQTKVRY